MHMEIKSSMEKPSEFLYPWSSCKVPGSIRLYVKIWLNSHIWWNGFDTFWREFFNVIKKQFSDYHLIINLIFNKKI